MKMKFYREKKGMTQNDLAKLLDVDSNTISRIERTGKCRLEMAFCISKILEEPIEKIFFDEDKKA